MATGDPIGADLCVGTTDGNTLPEGGVGAEHWEDREISLGGGTVLTSGIQYAIVVRALDASGDWEFAVWAREHINPYEGGDLYRSDDSGESWSVFEETGYADCWFKTKSGGVEKDDGSFEHDGFERVYTAGTLWFAQTFTADSTYTIDAVVLKLSRWSDSEPGTITVSIRAIEDEDIVVNKIYLGSAGSFLAAMTDKGIYLSTDLGDTWTQKLPDETAGTNWLSGVCSSTGTYIIVEAGVGTIYRSANSGTAWAEITPAGGDTFTVNKMAISETGEFVLIVGLNATDAAKSCYLSEDYGATWTAIYPAEASIEWEQCDISLDGTVLIVSNVGGDVYVSSDSGVTWVVQVIGSTSNTWNCLAVSGDGTLKLIANTANNDEVFKNGSSYSVPTWAESTITSAGRALLDDTTQTAQQTTLGLGTGDSPTFTGLSLSGLTASQFVLTSADKALASLAVPLTVPYGGTGLTTITDHGLLLGSATGAITPLAEATNGQIPIGSTGNNPVLATITGTAKRVTVANTAGVITLSGPQDLDTVDSPTFGGLTVTGNSVLGLNSAVFQPAVDAVDFYKVNDKDGNNILTIDTINNAWLPTTTKLGTVEGSYNFINGSAFAAKTGYTYCVAIGSDIANSATGNVHRNNLVGSSLANSATGDVTYNNLVGSLLASSSTGGVYYNNLVGYLLANSATGSVYYNNLVGSSLANSATGIVYRNNLVGSDIANSATGNVLRNNLVGSSLANSATGDVTNTTLYGSNIANTITGSIDSTFAIGTLNLYNTTVETDLARVIAMPYEALRESSAANLDDAIAIGYQAGYQNAYNSPALFGRSAVANANNQMVFGSSFYTGGLRFISTGTFNFKNTTHSDADGGGAVLIQGTREDGAGTPTIAGQISISHDGPGANDQLGKIIESVNTGAGLVESRRVNSDLSQTFAGDIFYTGGAGLTYGSMYSISNMAITMTTQNVWYEIDAAAAWVTGKVHNCTFTDPYLTATNAGTYLVTWNIVGRIGTANQVIDVGIMVDQTVTDNPAHGAAGVQGEGRGAVEFLNAARRLGTSGSMILQIAAGKKVSLAVRNITSAAKVLTVSKGNLKIVQIAGGSA